MVYLDPGDLKWKPYVQTWLDSKFPIKLQDATKVRITSYFVTYIVCKQFRVNFPLLDLHHGII